jgi:hypothetical protein
MQTWDELRVDLDRLIDDSNDYLSKTNMIYVNYMSKRNLAKLKDDKQGIIDAKKWFDEEMKKVG